VYLIQHDIIFDVPHIGVDEDPTVHLHVGLGLGVRISHMRLTLGLSSHPYDAFADMCAGTASKEVIKLVTGKNWAGPHVCAKGGI